MYDTLLLTTADLRNQAPPAFLLKTKRFVVNIKRLKGSMGMGIDDQHGTMSKGCGAVTAIATGPAA